MDGLTWEHKYIDEGCVLSRGMEGEDGERDGDYFKVCKCVVLCGSGCRMALPIVVLHTCVISFGAYVYVLVMFVVACMCRTTIVLYDLRLWCVLFVHLMCMDRLGWIP